MNTTTHQLAGVLSIFSPFYTCFRLQGGGGAGAADLVFGSDVGYLLYMAPYMKLVGLPKYSKTLHFAERAHAKSVPLFGKPGIITLIMITYGALNMY